MAEKKGDRSGLPRHHRMAVHAFEAMSEHLLDDKGKATTASTVAKGYTGARAGYVAHEGDHAVKHAKLHTDRRYHPSKYGWGPFKFVNPWYYMARSHAKHVHEAAKVLGEERADATARYVEGQALNAAVKGARRLSGWAARRRAARPARP